MSLFRYSGGMGKTGLGPAGSLAAAMADIVLERTSERGGDNSGRWLAGRSSRAKDYWRGIFSHEKPLTVNDVAEVAAIIGMTPVQLVQAAEARIAPAILIHVVPTGDTAGVDELTVLTKAELQQRDLELAALRDQENQDGNDARTRS